MPVITQVDTLRGEPHSEQPVHGAWRVAAAVLTVASAILFVVVVRSNLQQPHLSLILLLAMATLFGIFVLLLAGVLLQLRHNQRDAASVIEATEKEFQEMADNIQEIFWMIDADSKKALYVNQAYETITGRSRRSLIENPSSCEEIIYPEDRPHVLAKLEKATQTGQFDERFRIICRRGEVRWVKVHGFPVRDDIGRIRRLVGTAQEITAQKQAEDQLAKNLEVAQSAWAETEALHKATLALTQYLQMDSVLVTLLRSLGELIPYTCARILVPEGGPHVLALGERFCPEPINASSKYPLTLNADKSPPSEFSQIEKHVDFGHGAGERMEDIQGTWSPALLALRALGSFRTIPRAAIGRPHRTESLHSGASAPRGIAGNSRRCAIQNARLYETAQIYGSELEKKIGDLKQAEAALAESEDGRRMSEEKFKKVFRSSPIPFSITTVNEGRFLDINAAFERRYGYLREDVIGRTVGELRIWEDPADRALMLAQLHRGGPIRNVITRLRTKSGEVKTTAYSADKIQFDGQSCILAVSEDLPDNDQRFIN